MKKFVFILPAITLLLFTSCVNDDDGAQAIDPNILEEVDQFYVRINDNGEMSSIEASSFTDYEHYSIVNNNAFGNEEEGGRYKTASVNGTSSYEIANVASAKIGFGMSKNVFNNGDHKVQAFNVDITSSNQKDIICNQENALIEEMFQAQNNLYAPLVLTNSESVELLKTNFDLALFNIEYSITNPSLPLSINQLRYKSFTYNDNVSNIYTQPTSSFLNITSVTEKNHRARTDNDTSIYGGPYDYDYIIEGNGKVRLYSNIDPENDYIDIEFIFKIPSRKLVPFNIICN